MDHTPGSQVDQTGKALSGAAYIRSNETRERILMEMRPCFDGYAGIPQETRLLFAEMLRSDRYGVGGLLNGGQSLGKFAEEEGRRMPKRRRTAASTLLRQTMRLIALDSGPSAVQRPGIPDRLLRRLVPGSLHRRMQSIGKYNTVEDLTAELDPVLSHDWLWTRLFRLGMSPADRSMLLKARFPLPKLSWGDAAQLAAARPRFRPTLDLAAAGWDMHIAHTPCPYRIVNGKLVVRYHDAIPLLWPHTIDQAGPHAYGHFRMLQANVSNGAWFVCTSEPVRQDLLSVFPEVESRTAVIPTMSAPIYRPDPRPRDEVMQIIKRGQAAALKLKTEDGESVHTGKEAGKGERAPSLDEPFLLSVSTLEPRKNYQMLMNAVAEAWRSGARIRLVMVANIGWRSENEMSLLRSLVREGIIYHLTEVPSADLRALYSAAHMVVCPSRAEGFDLATVEAMACGAPVLASDIPVHRWVCEDAVEYFDAYDEKMLAEQIIGIAAQSRDGEHLSDMRARSLKRAAMFGTDRLMGQWDGLLETVRGAT